VRKVSWYSKRKAKKELWIELEISRLQFVGIYDDMFHNSAFDDTSTHCIAVTYLYQLTHEEGLLLMIGDSQHTDFWFFDFEDNSLHDMVKMRISAVKKLFKI
jgi:ADP-ribose pyrophosphatase YjhB (NUDIX family)